MGSTLPAIVTAVVAVTGMPYDFSLWEAAMVVVLLSRTRYANQIVFVGDKRETVVHLIKILTSKQHRFVRYITQLLEKVCGERTDVQILQQPTAFRPKDTIMTSVPGVYLIVSTNHPEFCLYRRNHKSHRTTPKTQQWSRTGCDLSFWSPPLCHVCIRSGISEQR
jgi:hypothetical protein